MNLDKEKKKLKINQKKYGGSSSVVSLRMPEKLIEKIDAVASMTERTRNDIIIRFIDFGLENLEIENTKDNNEIDVDDDN